MEIELTNYHANNLKKLFKLNQERENLIRKEDKIYFPLMLFEFSNSNNKEKKDKIKVKILKIFLIYIFL